MSQAQMEMMQPWLLHTGGEEFHLEKLNITGIFRRPQLESSPSYEDSICANAPAIKSAGFYLNFQKKVML